VEIFEHLALFFVAGFVGYLLNSDRNSSLGFVLLVGVPIGGVYLLGWWAFVTFVVGLVFGGRVFWSSNRTKSLDDDSRETAAEVASHKIRVEKKETSKTSSRREEERRPKSSSRVGRASKSGGADTPRQAELGGWLFVLVLWMTALWPLLALLGVLTLIGEGNRELTRFVVFAQWKSWQTFVPILWGIYLFAVGLSIYAVEQAKTILWISGPVTAVAVHVIFLIVFMDQRPDIGRWTISLIESLLATSLAPALWGAYLKESKRVRARYIKLDEDEQGVASDDFSKGEAPKAPEEPKAGQEERPTKEPRFSRGKAAPASASYGPTITGGTRVCQYECGEYRAVLVRDPESFGPIKYPHLLIVFESVDHTPPIMFVTAEQSVMAPDLLAMLPPEIRKDLGPDAGNGVFLGVFYEGAHSNLGESDEWAILEKFEPKALAVMRSYLNLTSSIRVVADARRGHTFD
jgi:hypothetical protein